MARLKVLVIDCAASQQAAEPASHSLGRQGDVMLPALLRDLGDLPTVELLPVVTREDTPGQGLAGIMDGTASGPVNLGVAEQPACWEVKGMTGRVAEPVSPLPYEHKASLSEADRLTEHFGAHFDARVQAADAVWPLAFESAGWLEALSRRILHHKRILLGSAPGAVQAATSKLALARLLADSGVATAATYSPHAALPRDGGPWVVKPDDGAGCLHTLLFTDRGAALAWIRASAADRYVLQPFIVGKPGSLSLICCDGAARVLSCNRHRVAMHDNRFHVLGTIVNGLADDDGALARLAQQVAAAIPTLWGHVGVDFVLTAQGAVVLDVNPRLTAAYAGLRASIDSNPAALVLGLLQGPLVMPSVPGMRRPVNVDVDGVSSQ